MFCDVGKVQVSGMAELICGAVTCTYNKDKCCCKGDIMVGGKHADSSDSTCCESFREQGADSYTNSTAHPSRTISIDCEAVKCIYNENYRCKAEHVDITGNRAMASGDTACATFKEK